MSFRQRLPNKRRSVSFEIVVGTLRYTVTYSRYADGRVGEIFIQNTKPGSQSDCYARDAAISASLALQCGCPLETLRRALLRDPQGRPQTPLAAALDRIAELEAKP
jgi:ribonucleoside-diphosphate reductase alpha chain